MLKSSALLPLLFGIGSLLGCQLLEPRPLKKSTGISPTPRISKISKAGLNQSATLEPPLLLGAPASLLPDPNAPAPAQTPILKAATLSGTPEAAMTTARVPESGLPPIPAPPGESAPPPANFLLPAHLFAPPAPTSAPTSAPSTTPAPATTPPTAPAAGPVPTAPPNSASAQATTASVAAPAPAPAAAPTPAPRITHADHITNKLVRTKLPAVFIYASPTTRQYLAAGGINYQNNLDIWQLFLKRQDVPFEVIGSLAKLDPQATLILPSALALNAQEKRSISQFQQQGGNLLATWLCGVRNENGAWVGFQFMEQVLQTRVVGTTEPDNDDSFLLPYGDSPVSHQLAAGLRVWTERIPNWYPLRLASPHLAAQLTDWSRTLTPKKRAGLISYAQGTPATRHARSVVLGFPERLWFSADPKALDALASDALFWLMHQPAVYLATWPHPYRSAAILSINASDFTEEQDSAFAAQTEGLGWRATYYVLSERAELAKPILKKLQARGHDIAYFGDRLVGFQNQSANQQGKRLDSMIHEFQEAEIEPSEPTGFRAPLDSLDATTLRLLRQRGIGHVITDQGASEARLPFFSANTPGAKGEAMVLLPRTLSAPEDLLTDNSAALATQNTIYELELADDMASLGILTIPTRSSITPANWGAILQSLKARKDKIWLSTANQVSAWWRERERVKVSLDADVTPALLTVEVNGEGPLQQAPTLLVNLPEPGRTVQLAADGHNAAPPKITPFDNFRAAIVLPKLAPGTYHWYLSF